MALVLQPALIPLPVRQLVVILAYNEESSLMPLLTRVQRDHAGFDLLVIDDASTDRTAAVARAAGVPVVSLPVNLGIGGAEQTGFLYAWEKGYDIMVRMDGDGQHDPVSIPQMVAPLHQGTADWVIGSRFIHRTGFQSSFYRRLGMGFFRLLNRLVSGQDITDTTSGFHACNRRAIAVLKDNYPGDFPEPEAIVILKKRGLSIREIPVEMTERRAGASSIRGWKAAYFMCKVALSMFVEFSRGKHE